MKCLRSYKWVQLPRKEIPKLKGKLGFWLHLAERAAFRKGYATYCGHKNLVEPGMWTGGIVGVKAILGVRSREKAFQALDDLQELGYLTYSHNSGTKELSYHITDWVVEYSGEECMEGVVYTTPKYGFLCVPRNITERIVEQGRKFEEADAWLDLWCHTVFRDKGNAFSFLSPVIQYGKFESVLSLEILGKRWGWEKTKVWRFFQKFAPYFRLCRLPGSCGCVIYNQCYPVCDEINMPEDDDVIRIFRGIRICAQNTHTAGTRNEKINRYTAWKSHRVITALEECEQNRYRETAPIRNASKISVALFAIYNTRVTFSCRNCKNCKNCIYACGSNYKGPPVFNTGILYPFSGPNPFFDLDRRSLYVGEIVFPYATG